MLRKKYKIIVIFLIIIFLSTYYFFEGQSNFLKVSFINVGQGDAIFIKTPNNKNILIDGGPSSDFIHKLGQKHSYKNHKIDILILTHAHADHFYGLIELIKRYDIKLILWSGIKSNSYDYIYFDKLIQKEKLKTKVAILGQTVQLEKNLKIKILYPINFLKEETIEDKNNTSVSLILKYKNIDFFLAGDLTCEGEDKIIKQNLNIACEIYKVSHHGSRWSNCNSILNEINPEISIIQSGIDNKHKHPHQETLTRLNNKNIKIYRNDLLGDINIHTDGDKYWVK